jgi:hypothetical protein
MRWNGVFAAALVVSALTGLGCPPAPKKDYTPAELAGLGDLTEIMRELSQKADPWFGRRTETSFSDADYAQMLVDAERIEAAARGASGAPAAAHPKGFADFAKGLEAQAVTWREAAKSKDAKAVDAALEAMKQQCAGCHSAYR